MANLQHLKASRVQILNAFPGNGLKLLKKNFLKKKLFFMLKFNLDEN